MTDWPGPKDQFTGLYRMEHATTLRVLNAFPPDQAGLRPHPRARSAMELAWIFPGENAAALAALRGQPRPAAAPVPGTWPELLAAYSDSTRALLETLAAASEADLFEPTAFRVGPGAAITLRRIEVLWMELLDSIHHRGQFSVYLRMSGAPVPSIYGPTLDAP